MHIQNFVGKVWIYSFVVIASALLFQSCSSDENTICIEGESQCDDEHQVLFICQNNEWTSTECDNGCAEKNGKALCIKSSEKCPETCKYGCNQDLSCQCSSECAGDCLEDGSCTPKCPETCKYGCNEDLTCQCASECPQHCDENGVCIDFDWSKLKSYTSTPYLTFDQYSNVTNRQGSCNFGKYFFQGFDRGRYISIVDLEQKKNIALLETGMDSDKIHVNSLFFGSEYAESNDPFPLLYASSGYGIAQSDGASNAGEIYVFRIIKENEKYRLNKVQTIVYQTRKWLDAVIDTDSNTLHIRLGNNEYYQHPVPKLSDGERVILQEQSQTNKISRSVNSCQHGMAFYQGKIYMSAGAPRSITNGPAKLTEDGVFIEIYNPKTNQYETPVDLIKYGYIEANKISTTYQGEKPVYKVSDSSISNDFEPESVFIWNDAFYIAYSKFIVKLEFEK